MHISIIIMRLAAIRIMARSSFSRCVYYIRPMPVFKYFLHIFFALVVKKTRTFFFAVLYFMQISVSLFKNLFRNTSVFSNCSRFSF